MDLKVAVEPVLMHYRSWEVLLLIFIVFLASVNMCNMSVASVGVLWSAADWGWPENR